MTVIVLLVAAGDFAQDIRIPDDKFVLRNGLTIIVHVTSWSGFAGGRRPHARGGRSRIEFVRTRS